MKRLAYRLYRIATGTRYWLPRRFTPAGFLVLAFVLVSAAVGVDMEQTVSFQIFALLFALVVVSAMAGRFFRGRFEVQRHLPRFATAGHPLIYRATIENQNPWIAHNLEWLEEMEDPRPTFEEFLQLREPPGSFKVWWQGVRKSWKGSGMNETLARGFRKFGYGKVRDMAPVRIGSIPPGGRTEIELRFVPARRGRLFFCAAVIARRDPFGFFRGFIRHPHAQQILVLPRRYPIPDLALPGSRTYQRGGVVYSSSIGESDEFASLRDYRPGDPLRQIHWRSWARSGKPIVKEFQDEHFSRHALVLDTLPTVEDSGEVGGGAASMMEGAGDPVFEEAVSTAASFACGVQTQESLLDLMFVGPQAVCLTLGRGVGHVEQALELLASARLQSGSRFEDLENLVLEHASNLCGCICVFRAWDEPRRQMIRRLEALSLPLLLLVIRESGTDDDGTRSILTEGGNRVHFLETGRIGEGLSRISGGNLA